MREDSKPNRSDGALAFAALLVGGAALGLSPIFVRLSDVGPTASAFWRLTLALPILWMWAAATKRARFDASPSLLGVAVLSGVFFAADLGVWHWSIRFTTVANSTLLANLAPIFVVLGSWIFFHARVSAVFIVGMLTALGGTALLVSPNLALGGTHLAGDLLGLASAVFYASYMLSIKRAREGVSTPMLMGLSTSVSVALLLPVTLLSSQPMWPGDTRGWAVLLGLALVSQVLGQSLIAYGFAHLSAALSSVSVLMQPIVAALLAWLLFDESLVSAQLLGSVLVLVGIVIARRTEG